MKTVGVLGFGPQATVDFEERFHRAAQRLIPQRFNTGYPPMVVYHCRHAPILLNADGTPSFPIQVDPQFLAAAARIGPMVDFMVIAANAPHMFQTEVERASGREVLSMIEVTLAEVRTRGWKRVGVLGMGDPTVYTRRLDELGIARETTDAERIARLNRGIGRVMEGAADEQDAAAARDAVASLRAKGVDGVILGCTEIPLLLRDQAHEPDLLDPLGYLAEAAVRRALAS